MPAEETTNAKDSSRGPSADSRKRGLSASAPTPEESKKYKVEEAIPPPATSKVEEPESTEPQPEETNSNSDIRATFPKDYTLDVFEDDGSYGSKHRRPRTYKLPGSGPHVFFTSYDMLQQVVSGMADGGCWMALKSSVLAVASATSELPKAEARELASDLMHHVGYWEVSLDDEAEKAAETEEAEALGELWSELDAPAGQWWYEVTVQQEKPAKGVPAIEITWYMYLDWYHIAEEQQGSWWLTGIALPGEESKTATDILEENIPSWYLH